MKQLQLIPEFNTRKEHGGTFSVGKRRKQRPLSKKKPLHLVLRSDFAYGSRSLLRHRPLIEKVIAKAKKRFAIRVYEMAVVSNHIHIMIKGHSRQNIQNFFRVVAGHIAQELLRQFPVLPAERIKRDGASETREKENKFWQTRIYSRIVGWGREYLNVKKYIFKNALEALGLIPYKTRAKRTSALKGSVKRTTSLKGNLKNTS